MNLKEIPRISVEAHIPGYKKSKYELRLDLIEPHLYWRGDISSVAMMISHRSVDQYEEYGVIPEDFFDQPNITSLKVIELTSGLAEFIPKFGKIASHRPFAVDIIDFSAIEKFLSSNISSCSPSQIPFVNEMIERARVIPQLANYICCPLEVLKVKHPELQGQFDMVVFLEAVNVKVHEIGRNLRPWLLKP